MHRASGIPWGNVALTAMIVAGGFACANVVIDTGRQMMEDNRKAQESFCRGAADLAKNSAERYVESFCRAYKGAGASTPSPAPSKSFRRGLIESALIHSFIGGIEFLAARTSRRLMRWHPQGIKDG